MESVLLHSVMRTLGRFLYVEPNERLKVALMSLSFFCIIGSYTVVRVLKDSLFTSMVGGRDALGVAKLWSMLLLIPGILLFSKLVDVMRKSHLMVFYCVLYALGCMALGYLVANPTFGLLNTQQGSDRWLGWLIYFFLEGFNPFVVSLFWAFCNSITAPQAAKSHYPLMVAASKLGGVVVTTIACWLLQSSVALDEYTAVRDAYNHQILFYASGALLICVPGLIYLLYHWVPVGQLHGYEAAYQADRLKDKQGARAHDTSWRHAIAQSLEGLILMTRIPYVMGVFGVAFFWELVNVFINFERVDAAGRAAVTISDKSRLLLEQDFWVHTVGLLITLIGTRALMARLGERRSLLLMPVATGLLLVLYFISKTESYGSSAAAIWMMGLTYVLMKALNYAFAQPLKESLYIPTTRSVKFKSKSWIDSFGTKFAKAMGSMYAKGTAHPTTGLLWLIGGIWADTLFFGAVIGGWIIVANLLGNRYEQAIRKQEVIGGE
jgi:ATP:ADP antiporter, AAA family